MAWPPVETIALTWISDSGKRESLHRNGPDLSMADSYLGHLAAQRNGDEVTWGYYVKDDPDFKAAGSYPKARKALERAAWAAVR